MSDVFLYILAFLHHYVVSIREGLCVESLSACLALCSLLPAAIRGVQHSNTLTVPSASKKNLLESWFLCLQLSDFQAATHQRPLISGGGVFLWSINVTWSLCRGLCWSPACHELLDTSRTETAFNYLQGFHFSAVDALIRKVQPPPASPERVRGGEGPPLTISGLFFQRSSSEWGNRVTKMKSW